MNKSEEYKGYFADCYILSSQKSKSYILDFLNYFIPNREESADEYEVPQYGNKTDLVFSSSMELIDFLVEKHQEPYTIYWKNTDKSDLIGSMCFFTTDGNIILGISTETKFPNTEIEVKIFKQSRITYQVRKDTSLMKNLPQLIQMNLGKI